MRKQPKLIQRADSPYWFIYVPKSGQQRASRLSTGETDYRQAEQVFAQWVIEGKKPELTQSEEVRVIDILVRYADYKKDDNSTKYFMRHLQSWFKNVMLSQITNGLIRDYVTYRVTQYAQIGKKKAKRFVSQATVRRELNTFVAALNFYRKEGFIKEVPFVYKPEDSLPRQRWLTDDEFYRLLNAARLTYMTTFLMIARHTAARPSSILQLKWFQIDFEKRILHLNPEMREQTKKFRPSLYINDDLFEYLTKLYVKKNSEYVVATIKKGDPIKDIGNSFRAACERAGIEGATPYTLRHTTLTKIVRNGHGLAHAGQVGGHKDPRTTMRYVKHDSSFTKNALASLSTGVTNSSVPFEPKIVNKI